MVSSRVTVVFCIVTVLLVNAQDEASVSERCLQCICKATSNCNQNAGCSGDVCGPFGITWGYWYDGGEPVLKGDDPDNGNAYSRCTRNLQCASTAVQNYMARYRRDCNGDGVVDCYDYASIHRLGGAGCTGRLDSRYSRKFKKCMGIA